MPADPEQEDLAPTPGGLERVAHGRERPGRLDRHVEGPGLGRPDHILVRSHRGGQLALDGAAARDGDPRGRPQPDEVRREQPEGAGTDDHDAGSGLEIHERQPAKHHGGRFDQCAGLQRHPGIEPVDEVLARGDARAGGSVPHEAQLVVDRAQVRLAPATRLAHRARDDALDHHGIPGHDLGDLVAHGRHGARPLVAQDEGVADVVRVHRAAHDLEIRPAQSDVTRRDAHLQSHGSGPGSRLDPDVVRSADDECRPFAGGGRLVRLDCCHVFSLSPSGARQGCPPIAMAMKPRPRTSSRSARRQSTLPVLPAPADRWPHDGRGQVTGAVSGGPARTTKSASSVAVEGPTMSPVAVYPCPADQERQ